MPPGEPLSTAHAVRMLKLAAEHDVPPVLTNAVRYVAEDGAATADVLDSARALKSLPELSADPLLQPNGQGWLKPAAQMLRLGKEIIHTAGYGAADLKQLLAQTEALADRCRMDPATDMGWKQPVVPEASVIGIDGDPLVELSQRCEAGISAGGSPDITGKAAEQLRARLEHELRIIDSLGFASYFLTVAEVSRMIQDMGVRAAARGSGASSLVNYLHRRQPGEPAASTTSSSSASSPGTAPPCPISTSTSKAPNGTTSTGRSLPASAPNGSR